MGEKDKNDGKKTRGYKGDQTGRSVKWAEKKSKMVCKLTELINNPLKEQMLPKKTPHLKICPKNLIIGLNLNNTQTHFKQTLIVPVSKTLIKP